MMIHNIDTFSIIDHLYRETTLRLSQQKEPVIQSFDDFFAVSLNKLLNQQTCGWWNEIL